MGAKPLYRKTARAIVRPFYAKFRKHYCSECGGLLKIVWLIHYGIKKGSDEARYKYFRFDIFNNPIDYKFAIFECVKCSHKLSINDQYFIENPNKLERYNSKYGDYRLRDDYHQYLRSNNK